jgi:hypothetical protein
MGYRLRQRVACGEMRLHFALLMATGIVYVSGVYNGRNYTTPSHRLLSRLFPEKS